MIPLFALSLVLMISSISLASTESFQLGPYHVSFNLNAGIPHQSQVFDPIQTSSSTIYGMKVSTDDATNAKLVICEYELPIDSNLNLNKQLAAMEMTVIGLNATSVQDRTIDGKEGFFIQSEPFPGVTSATSANFYIFRALYWLDSKSCECGPVSVGKTSVGLTSSYSQDVTENLLNSLHVVQLTSTAFQSVSVKPDVSQSHTNKDIF